MALYCWGNTAHGELGVGGIEEEQISTPRSLDWPGSEDIVFVACGLMHTLLLTSRGKVYSCGSNDYGQLGQQISRKRPQLVAGLDNYTVQQVACGAAHSVALNEWGQCFVWGSNSRGQLCRDPAELPMCNEPTLIKQLATRHIVQIASGVYHTLALTNDGQLFAWGANAYGQLGVGTFDGPLVRPTLIATLVGIPLAYIACGGNHSFAVSKSGAVFAWGKNLFGQLGTDTIETHAFPTHLRTLRSRGVRHIACGDDFSMFLTLDGAVFTCGSGTYGQLGHGTASDNTLPRAIAELMGTTCTQIACGSRHSLVFVPTRGRIYGFGLGASGQLGTKTLTNATLPQVVLGPWLSPSGQCLVENTSDQIVGRIFAGGDQSFVSAVAKLDASKTIDSRYWSAESQIVCFSSQLAETCARIKSNETIDQDLMTLLETIFRSLSCLNASFQQRDIGKQCCSTRHSNVDLAEVQSAFEHVARIEHDALKQIIWEGLTARLDELAEEPNDMESLRIYLVLPFYHEFANPKRYAQLHSRYVRSVLRLKSVPTRVLSGWWSALSKEHYERLIDVFRDAISYIIQFVLRSPHCTGPIVLPYDEHLMLCMRMLFMLFRLNRFQRRPTDQIPHVRFHLPGLDELVNMPHEYMMWLLDRRPDVFYLCEFPFLFDTRTKTILLQTDQSIQMNSAMNQHMFTAAMNPFLALSSDPFIMIRVRREHIVEDTLREMQQFHIGELKKPLRVVFDGEEAEDAGGVRKEFFLLLLRDLLDPKYGMFAEYDETRAIWFSEQTFEDYDMFMLVGTLCGLAMYNFTIIHLPFPLALYKKLLDHQTGLDDVRELSPTIANSLQSLLDYDGPDFVDVFDLTFELTRQVFGEMRRIALKPDGENVPVTQENKEEFVQLYVQYILDTSVERQFKGFRDGFMRVCGGKVMGLFQPHELMAVVIGNEDYDWLALEENSTYRNGYTSGDPTIRMFWEVFHKFPLEEKKKFLLFLTGSDRIPIQGMKAIKLYFEPTNNETYLPVAHTCFNLLDLPRYKTKERLRFKLSQAIQQTLGFSLV